MAQKPCGCGGSNENCCHCFGSGFIRVRDVPSKRKEGALESTGENWVKEFVSKHPLLNPNPLRQPEGTEPTRRQHPASHKEAKGSNLERGLYPDDMAKVRARLLARMSKEHGNPTCGQCYARFSRYADLVKHRRAGCQKPKATPIRVQYLPSHWSAQKHSGMTTCEHCGCPLKTVNISRHLGKCPKYSKRVAAAKSVALKPRGGVFSETVQRQPFRSIASAKKTDPRSAFAQANAFDRVDATRLYAYSFRENGKYGSHPLHDGMDDESGPD
jgi:hypothetical protein